MPYAVRKLIHQPFYRVYNKDTNRVYSYHTTKENAIKQLHLLESIGDPDEGVNYKKKPREVKDSFFNRKVENSNNFDKSPFNKI